MLRFAVVGFSAESPGGEYRVAEKPVIDRREGSLYRFGESVIKIDRKEGVLPLCATFSLIDIPRGKMDCNGPRCMQGYFKVGVSAWCRVDTPGGCRGGAVTTGAGIVVGA